MIVLELKQKPTVKAGPNKSEISKFHGKLSLYVEGVINQKKYEIVAGFVVVMYANGTKFCIEPTTSHIPSESLAAKDGK